MNLIDYKKDLPCWTGKFRRKKQLEDKRILLLSTKGMPPEEGERNLIAIDKDENILWIAELPDKDRLYDSYFNMKYKDGIIQAESSSHYVDIDAETGKILKVTQFY